MLNPTSILHPADFSDSSLQALKCACSLATQFDANLHLINVINDAELIVPPITGFIPPDYYEQQSNYATEKLASYPNNILNYNGPIVRNVCGGVPFV